MGRCYLTGRFSGVDDWPVLSVHRGFIPEFKLFLAVNHRPTIRGTDHAIWRRVRLIPFEVTIPDDQQDKTLPQKLEEEQAGILRWMVEGCLLWQQGGLEPPESVRQATAGYREEMDTVGTFIDECCIRDPDIVTPAADLYTAYRAWAERNGDIPMSKADFGSRLTEKGFTPARTRSARSWRGLGIDPVTG